MKKWQKSEQIFQTVHSLLDHSLESKPLQSSQQLKKQMNKKYEVCLEWNCDEEIQNKRLSEIKSNSVGISNNSQDILASLLNFSGKLQKKNEQESQKKISYEPTNRKFKLIRRERFKKMNNPIYFIQHYMSKQGFQPSAEENMFINELIKLKQKIDYMEKFSLHEVLTCKPYLKYRVVSVDEYSSGYQQAEVSDDDRDAMREYMLECEINAKNFLLLQSGRKNIIIQRVISTYTSQAGLKISNLMEMGRIAEEIYMEFAAIIFYKKALQYAWRSNSIESELSIYDHIGRLYSSMGEAKRAHYYHSRYSQAESEAADSAARRVSAELLAEYDEVMMNSEKENLSELFLQYVDLPITNFTHVPATKVSSPYSTYINGESPRKKCVHREFDDDKVLDVKSQIMSLLTTDPEFHTEIPDPEFQKNVIIKPIVKKHSELARPFQRSPQYNKIRKSGPPSVRFPSLYKISIEEEISRKLEDKPNPLWWQQMKKNCQHHRKIPKIRSKVEKSHLSYHKYPQERQRAESLKQTKINVAINGVLLQVIDPVYQ